MPVSQQSPLLSPPVQKSLKTAVAYFRKRLMRARDAREFLLKAGVAGTSAAACGLGFSDGTLAQKLPPSDSKEGALLREHLLECGLLFTDAHGRIRESFENHILMPVTDRNRVITQVCAFTSSGEARFLPVPHTNIPNEICLISKTVFVCDNPLDMLMMYSRGQRNVTFVRGAELKNTSLHVCLSQAARLYLAFKDASYEAALLHAGIAAFTLQLPEGESLTDAVYKSQASALELMKNAVPVGAPDHPEKNGKHHPKLVVLNTLNPHTNGSSGTPEPVVKGDVVFIERTPRHYRIDGFFKNRYTASLPVTLELKIPPEERRHVDQIDMYDSGGRDKYTRRAAKKFSLEESVVEDDLDAMLVRLRQMQDELIAKKLESGPEKIVLSESERDEAERFLRKENLIKRILSDFKKCGIVGEEMNLLANYLIAVSRLLEKPLHALYQSSSAAGKSTLMKAVLAFMPQEIVFLVTAMSRQSLFYMVDHVLRGMILAFEEDIGKDLIGYPLKTLMSDGHATFAAPVKDEKTGELRTKKTHVSGAPSVWTTSTAHTISEEDQNRNVILAPDESPEQTRRILEDMRFKETQEGQARSRAAAKIRTLHQNAQRCLRPLLVRIPDSLKLPLPGSRQRLRRDYPKYIGFLKASAVLHQFQRRIIKEDGVEYVVATREDLETANMIADAVLGHSLDECPPHTRSFFSRISELADDVCRKKKTDRHNVRLTAREMADYTGLSLAQTHKHLGKLSELEFVQAWPGKGGRRFEYEILSRKASPGAFFPAPGTEAR